MRLDTWFVIFVKLPPPIRDAEQSRRNNENKNWHSEGANSRFTPPKPTRQDAGFRWAIGELKISRNLIFHAQLAVMCL